MTDCCLHASNPHFTNRQGQKIGDITQVLDPGVDEIDKCFVTYPAGEFPGVDAPVSDVNEDSFVEHPIDTIPEVDVELGDAELTGVDMAELIGVDTAELTRVDMVFDAKSTGVEVDTGKYSEAYDTIPQEQGNDSR